MEDESRIGPDDLLQISVFEAPDLNRTLRVSANGEISLQLLGPVKAGGLTPRQLELVLQELLRRTYMKNPHVGVFVQELQSHPVSVVGAVKKPGVFQIRGTKTVLELLSMAEGLADDAGDTVLVMRGASTTGSIGRGNAEQESQKDGQDSTTPGDAALASKPAGLPSKGPQPEIVEVNLKSLLESDDPAFNIPIHSEGHSRWDRIRRRRSQETRRFCFEEQREHHGPAGACARGRPHPNLLEKPRADHPHGSKHEQTHRNTSRSRENPRQQSS
jgi:protein involved in polysaccharide export with SLBB domain